MPTEKNFRHGHRERVRARFLREGLSAFADYEVLELLLFYAIPRRDTKEQAHALDDMFGSLYHALTASEAELCKAPGIGGQTALFLRSLLPFLDYVATKEPHADVCPDNKALAKRIYPHLERDKKESSLIAFLSNRDEVICVYPLEGGKPLSRLAADELITMSFTYRAASVAIADYKRDGIPFPSHAVVQGVRHLREEMVRIGVSVRDYLLFTDTQYNSLIFTTGDPRFQARSPFFIDPEKEVKPPFPTDSAQRLVDVLRFVTKEEKAAALAHRLLEKYSTLANILALPYETLLAENPADGVEVLYLKILFELRSRAMFSRIRFERRCYTSAKQVGQMFSDAIGFSSEENVVLAMFDKEMRLIDLAICAKGAVNTASFVMRNLAELAYSRRAAFVALAHNHPSGSHIPSMIDIGITSDLAHSFRQMKIGFVDHFVVTTTAHTCISRIEDGESCSDMPKSFFK